MELSAEKTLITHSSKAANFLGYEISVNRNEKIKPDKNGITKRDLNKKVELNVLFKNKIETFLIDKGVAVKKKRKLMPSGQASLIRLTNLEIVSTYNAELRKD